jgi:hypothetical protein
MGEQVARFKPGVNVPAFAVTQVNAGHFVKIVADKTSQGDYSVGHAGSGDHTFGVAERDSAPTTQPDHSVERRINIVRRGAIARVLAGADLTAGQAVMSDANGKAVPLTDTAIAASLVVGTVGANNAVKFTALEEGAEGNEITVTVVNPGTASAPLSVDVNNGTDIVISLATNGSSVVTSTAAQVIAAVEAHDAASGLVVATNSGASNGSGVEVAAPKANLAGGADAAQGTRAGFACENITHDNYGEIDLV